MRVSVIKSSLSHTSTIVGWFRQYLELIIGLHVVDIPTSAATVTLGALRCSEIHKKHSRQERKQYYHRLGFWCPFLAPGPCYGDNFCLYASLLTSFATDNFDHHSVLQITLPILEKIHSQMNFVIVRQRYTKLAGRQCTMKSIHIFWGFVLLSRKRLSEKYYLRTEYFVLFNHVFKYGSISAYMCFVLFSRTRAIAFSVPSSVEKTV